MKILFDCAVPFALTHGGQQVQIEQTKEALESLGVDVEYFRWWDERQCGDIIHFFGRPPLHLIEAAHRKNVKIIAADLLSAQGSRPSWRRKVQKVGVQMLGQVVPVTLLASTGWACLRAADACVSLTDWEAYLLREIYGVAAANIHVIPNGVEKVFLDFPATGERGRWLVCTATITQRKRVVELAEAAIEAQVPVWVIGRPYSEMDPYGQKFSRLTRASPEFLKYEGAIADRNRLARVYSEARGFVLLSAVESLSLSALEAAACGCPLLLSDLPWARGTFGNSASYCPVTRLRHRTAEVLHQFYRSASNSPLPPKPMSWAEVARKLKELYQHLMSQDCSR